MSPVECIPHKSKAFRVIQDLLFKLWFNKQLIPSVNDTKTCNPQEAVIQLGTSLQRIVSTMVDNHNMNCPFMFSKLDIKDGFWRTVVDKEYTCHFVYVLQPIDGSTPDNLEGYPTGSTRQLTDGLV